VHQHSVTGHARIALKANEILSSDLNIRFTVPEPSRTVCLIQVYSEVKFGLVYAFTGNLCLI
jgi:hypothetical protein